MDYLCCHRWPEHKSPCYSWKLKAVADPLFLKAIQCTPSWFMHVNDSHLKLKKAVRWLLPSSPLIINIMYYVCITFFLIRVCLIFLLLFRVTVSATTHTPAFLAALQCILALDIVDNAIWFVLYSFLPSSLACVSLCLPLCVSPTLALALPLPLPLALAPPAGGVGCSYPLAELFSCLPLILYPRVLSWYPRVLSKPLLVDSTGQTGNGSLQGTRSSLLQLLDW